jgi:predicted ester cyclase
MSEQNLSGIARDLIDAFNARNSEQFKKQLTNTVVYDEIGINRKFQGADAWLQVWEHWRNAFPDLNGTITNAVACGNTTVARSLFPVAQSPVRKAPDRTDFPRACL